MTFLYDLFTSLLACASSHFSLWFMVYNGEFLLVDFSLMYVLSHHLSIGCHRWTITCSCKKLSVYTFISTLAS